MKSIALINFYFGNKIPEYMDFYLSSVSYNKTIDLFLFTNLNIKSPGNNIKIINTTFEEFSSTIIQHVTKGLNSRGIYDIVKISNPYKISDFRPCFGYCLEKYIIGYDFWGVSDLDLIFGDIRKYITEESLEKYDKLYENGHFFLIRNTKECNELFFEDYKNSFYSVLCSEKNSFYEEVYEKPWIPGGGINTIFDKKSLLYKNRKALCDISFKYHNLVDLKNPVKSKRIIFIFNEGKLYRIYKANNKLHKEEIFYAHFQKRKLIKKTDNYKKFCVTNTAFRSIPEHDEQLFIDTKKIDYITHKYFKFRYIDAIRRKINKDFKKRELE